LGEWLGGRIARAVGRYIDATIIGETHLGVKVRLILPYQNVLMGLT
jgi:hypothetical protein